MLVLAALPAESSPSPVDDVLAPVLVLPADPDTLVISDAERRPGVAGFPHALHASHTSSCLGEVYLLGLVFKAVHSEF